ncbi:MAG: tellurite methyltransferase [Myxococcota bacterium]
MKRTTYSGSPPMPEVKYDRHYRESPAACGAPFPELVVMAEKHGGAGVSVLDIGCGQGRDALLFARTGCTVVGVDHSAVGIAQLKATAKTEGLDLTAEVADMTTYQTRVRFDIVILDRVLHMLSDDAARSAVLQTAMTAVKPGGRILIADGPKHRALIRSHLTGWILFKDTKNRTFAISPR